MDFKRNLAAFLVHDFEMESKKKVSASASHHHHNDLTSTDTVKLPSSAFEENGLQEYNQVSEMEAVLVDDLIKPLIFLFKYFLPFHDTISFDKVAKCCVLVKGSFGRKTICVVFQLLVLYRLGIKAIPSIMQGFAPESGNSSGSTSSLAKGAYFIFTIFSCQIFCVYWLKTGKVCTIFNHVICLADRLHLKQQSPNSIKCVKVAVHASWIFVSSYVSSTVVLYGISILLPPLVAKNESADDISSQTSSNASHQGKGSGYQLDFTEIHISDDFIVIQIITSVTSFMNIFSWMMTFLHMSCWAIFFRQIFTIFYWRLYTRRELGQHFVVPHEIRTFNKIGSIIDEFNQIYGLSHLLGAVVVVTYISPSIKHAFSGLSNPLLISSGWHLLLSYIPMMAASMVMAEVQRKAGSFANILKEEYGQYTKECGDAAESLCGIAIVHYDLAMSNVGMKGLGFFTVSYQFITTIVSAIISYSILVVQLFPHDNSDIEV